MLIVGCVSIIALTAACFALVFAGQMETASFYILKIINTQDGILKNSTL